MKKPNIFSVLLGCSLFLFSQQLHSYKTVETTSGLTNPQFKAVDELIQTQKMQAAHDKAVEIYTAAKQAKDSQRTTEAVILLAQLKVALHKAEEAFSFMRDEPRPTAGAQRVLFDLYYGTVLEAYYQKYRWEIQSREKTTHSDKDLKTWTKEQISSEILKSYASALQFENVLNSEAPSYYQYYVIKNTFPKDVRSTLRDLVVYSSADHLADSSYWTAKDSNEVYTLPFKQMVQGTVSVSLTDTTKHPMTRLASLLSAHKSVHSKNGRIGGALEAQYVLFEKLLQHTGEPDQKELVKALEGVQQTSANKRHEWWAKGQYLLGNRISMFRDDENRFIKAVQVFDDAIKAYPSSYGAQKSTYEKAQILTPHFNIQVMSHDGAGKDSLQLTYKNITKIYFQAYALDLKKEIETAPGGELFSRKTYTDFQAKKWGKPVAEWSQDLLPTKDYTEHRAFIKPPLKKHGGYMIVASLREDFGEKAKSQIEGAPFILTDIVLQRIILNDGNIEVRAISGETGKPMSGVEISNWARNESASWEQPAVKRSSEVSGSDGIVRFKPVPKIYEYFQFAQKGDDVAHIGRTWVSDRTHSNYRNILVFTDRSIFRPDQKIHWKVLDFQGSTATAQFKVSAKQKLVVYLHDANNKVVGTKAVTTNDYGTASGEFVAAKDKALGNWRLVVKRGNDNYAGGASLRVEEYKRPTFEVTIKDSTQGLRLNKKASIAGEARYYFGQPVAAGSIKWRVERTPVWSWWWHGYRSYTAPQTVGTGTAKVLADGTFKIEFTPKADEREATNNPGLRYQFAVSADVTDEGGETRTGSKNIQLGFVSLDAQMPTDNEFYNSKKAIVIPVTLSDLNGIGKKGNGQWQLFKLAQPEKAALPADIPLQAQESTHKSHKHPGDTRRPRWSQEYDPIVIMQDWSEEKVVLNGAIVHDDKGKGEIKLSGLDEGAYRIVYKIKDEFGAELKVKKDILIAGNKNAFALALLVVQEKMSYEVGETARILITSGLKDQILFAEIYSAGIRTKKIEVKNTQILEIPITDKERGGFSLLITGVRDYQQFQQWKTITVPWTNKQLKIEMATFRDKIRPGTKETFKIVVKDHVGKLVGDKSAELLSFMYDRSLDFFGPHRVESPLSAYPSRAGVPQVERNLTAVGGTQYVHNIDYANYPSEPTPDYLVMFNSYGIGGPGSRGGGEEYEVSAASDSAPSESRALKKASAPMAELSKSDSSTQIPREKNEQKAEPSNKSNAQSAQAEAAPQPLRADFSETAFWKPHLLLGPDGSVSFEFQVPDSLTSWNFWVSAITQDIRAGVFNGQTQSVKELMVRPYLPRFLREGDQASLKVMINNAGEKEMAGEVELQIDDPETGKSLLSDFGLSTKDTKSKFTASKGGSTTVTYKLTAPKKIRSYAISVRATSKNISDGEKRILPVLPSRMHLAQSRFITLRNKDQKVMEFADLAKGNDPSLINDRMVLTIDAQLFYGVLKSLPYLINYPYECAEQTLNRFVSTGIVTEVFKKYPSVQKMAKEFSKRDTPLEKFDGADANQRMSFEESPWLQMAEGGVKREDAEMAKVLDSRIALNERDKALRKLRRMQTSSGGFPWFDGGKPDEYITLYMLIGFARANEFKVDVPKDMVVKAWRYLKDWHKTELKKCMLEKNCHEMATLLVFALTSYKDTSWTGGAFSEADKKMLLDYSFSAWKTQSPLIKGYLALSLKRLDRLKDAQLVWASVMDSAKSTTELGTYWAPEERSWLWYNDTIESHAFAIRVQMELAPEDKKNDGLVQWLFLNKKLNHWKSTKATAESIYSLVHYLEKEKSLGTREEITAKIGGQDKKFVFEPDKYTGAKNQIVISGSDIKAERDSKVTISKSTPGFAFASTTWHFSTEKVPEKGDGDMFSVSRKYFLREKKGTEWTLSPISSGTKIKVGDQIEVQVSLQAKHAAEYVHLRDPRGAGFEPEEQTAGYRYDLGLAYYQEVRDSGGNFFFNRLPVGQYTFKYRIRANMAGTFKVGPATVQSLYAPEFNAYSSGHTLEVQ